MLMIVSCVELRVVKQKPPMKQVIINAIVPSMVLLPNTLNLPNLPPIIAATASAAMNTNTICAENFILGVITFGSW